MHIDPRLIVILSAIVTSSACVLDGKVGDNPDDESGSSSDDASTDGGSTSDDNASTDDTGDPNACPIRDGSTCSPPRADCTEVSCGSLLGDLDENGCPRSRCDSCGADEVCFTPQDWGGCVGSGSACDELDGACVCGGTADCGGSYCVPADQAPPANCFEFQDSDACTAAGCNGFESGREIVIDESGQCSCGEPSAACLWFPVDTGGVASPVRFFEQSTGRVMFFGTGYEQAPLGWQSCTAGGDQAPAACQCFEDFMGGCE